MDRRSEELVVGYHRHEKSVPPALRPLILEIIRLRAVIGIADATVEELKDELDHLVAKRPRLG